MLCVNFVILFGIGWGESNLCKFSYRDGTGYGNNSVENIKNSNLSVDIQSSQIFNKYRVFTSRKISILQI